MVSVDVARYIVTDSNNTEYYHWRHESAIFFILSDGAAVCSYVTLGKTIGRSTLGDTLKMFNFSI